MPCAIDKKIVDDCISFHGHWCNGLAIGVRAAEYCLRELGHDGDEDVVAICETDMCGVDAIQFLTGCTLGKGNLIHRDYGKNAFTFYRRKPERGVRLVLQPDALGPEYAEQRALYGKGINEGLTEGEQTRMDEVTQVVRKHLMDLDLETIFAIGEPRETLPRPARIMGSHVCTVCGEPVMESRVRLCAGKSYCIPCFRDVEQKI